MTLVLTALSAQAPAADAVKRRLVGNWMLVNNELFDQTGASRPGNFAVGRLIYDEQGQMSAHLMRAGYAAHDAPVTDAARAAAYQGYVGYFGPYTIDAAKGIIVHHVVGASLPHWVGGDQIRYYALSADGAQLTLSLKTGERVTQTLTWERVK